VSKWYSQLSASKQIKDLKTDLVKFDIILNSEYLSNKPNVKLSKLGLSGQTVRMERSNDPFYEMIITIFSGDNYTSTADIQLLVCNTWNGKTLKKKVSEKSLVPLEMFDLKIKWKLHNEYNKLIIEDHQCIKKYQFDKQIQNVKLKMVPCVKLQNLLNYQATKEITVKRLQKEYQVRTRTTAQINFKHEGQLFLLDQTTTIRPHEESTTTTESQIVIVNSADGPIVTFNLKLSYKNVEGKQERFEKLKKKAQLKDNWKLKEVFENLRTALKIPNNIKIEFWIASDSLNEYEARVEDLALNGQEITVVREFGISETLPITYKHVDGSEKEDNIGYPEAWTTKKLKKQITEKLHEKMHESLKNYIVTLEDEDGKLVQALSDEELLRDYSKLLENEGKSRLVSACPSVLEIKFLGRRYRTLGDVVKRLKELLLNQKHMLKLKLDNNVVGDEVKFNDLNSKVFKTEDF